MERNRTSEGLCGWSIFGRLESRLDRRQRGGVSQTGGCATEERWTIRLEDCEGTRERQL